MTTESPRHPFVLSILANPSFLAAVAASPAEPLPSYTPDFSAPRKSPDAARASP